MKNTRGFTLIEVLVTMVVVMVLLLVAVPEYRRLTEDNRQVTAINKIVGDLNLARSEAVKRGRAVTLCGSTNGATCDTFNWESGWIVFIDVDRDRAVDNIDGDLLISRNTGLPAGLTLRGIKFASNDFMQYLPNVQLVGDDDGTFVVCDILQPTEAANSNLQRARAANVNALGRISVAKDPDDNGTRNDIENVDVTCP